MQALSGPITALELLKRSSPDTYKAHCFSYRNAVKANTMRDISPVKLCVRGPQNSLHSSDQGMVVVMGPTQAASTLSPTQPLPSTASPTLSALAKYAAIDVIEALNHCGYNVFNHQNSLLFSQPHFSPKPLKTPFPSTCQPSVSDWGDGCYGVAQGGYGSGGTVLFSFSNGIVPREGCGFGCGRGACRCHNHPKPDSTPYVSVSDMSNRIDGSGNSCHSSSGGSGNYGTVNISIFTLVDGGNSISQGGGGQGGGGQGGGGQGGGGQGGCGKGGGNCGGGGGRSCGDDSRRWWWSGFVGMFRMVACFSAFVLQNMAPQPKFWLSSILSFNLLSNFGYQKQGQNGIYKLARKLMKTM